MMKSLIAILLMSTTANAAKIPCKIKLPLVHDGCQGDWCAAVNHLLVEQDVDLVKDIQSKTVIQKIKKGTKIKKPFGFELEVKRSGIYRVIDKSFDLESTKYRLKRGMAFEVLYDAGQGYFAICVENDIEKHRFGESAEMIESVKADDWIKVKLDGKISGYVKRNDVKVISAE